MRADQPARRAGSKRCSSALLRSRRAATSAPASFPAEGETIDLGGRLVSPGFVETHIHLDKSCILDRCRSQRGDLEEAIAEAAKAKAAFTPEDVHSRAVRTLEKAIVQGTTHMRTHLEVDPGVGLRGLEGVLPLVKEFSWAIDLEICVFPQEGSIRAPTSSWSRRHPRGGAGHKLLHHGVNCSLSSNNILNPFTPFGDCSQMRMANLYANISQVGKKAEMRECFNMVTRRPAEMLRLKDYGLAVGKSADLVVLDSASPEAAVAELARALRL
jgi:cytosine/adenosine deaminase-related metal-dependent hydrolase